MNKSAFLTVKKKRKKTMKAMVISGGSIDRAFTKEWIQNFAPDYIVAADRGLLFCMEEKLKVDMIVGDFDSLPGGVIDGYLSTFDVPVRTFNPVKDYTDTEIALRQAMEAGADEILLFGVTGTRLDHCIGNMQCLHICLDAGIRAAILDPHNRITLHEKDFSIEKSSQFGGFVSFIPAGDAIRGLTLTGFKYPLNDRDITPTDSLCISNQITEETASVSFREGRLFMIESRD